ncbi:MAG: hypothetical protein RBR24_05225 [Candidatus Carbobacillus sp.]|nr:hypothetical protein [Candidatus Carbobacillus sp.]
MHDRFISKLIAKKTGSYLRLSLVLFLLSLLLLVSSFIFMMYQYRQVQKDFVDNSNTHLIEITSSYDVADPTRYIPLSYSDVTNVKALLTEHFPDRAQSFVVYTINFGIKAENDAVYFIRGTDAFSLKKLGLPDLIDNQALSAAGTEAKRIVLNIPVVQIEDGGYRSSETAAYPLTLIPYTSNLLMLEDLKKHKDTLYVNETTFQKIFEIALQMPWDEVVERYDRGEDVASQLVNKIFVYVDQLSDVKRVASLLEDHGYDLRYTLGAFDDLSRSINAQYWFMGVLLLLIYIITTINVVMSFRGYLRSMQKDMGILLHYGYTHQRVYRIYRHVIVHPFVVLFLILGLYTFVVSILFLSDTFFIDAPLAIVFLFLLIGIVMFMVLRILRRITEQDILYLLKASKEME